MSKFKIKEKYFYVFKQEKLFTYFFKQEAMNLTNALKTYIYTWNKGEILEVKKKFNCIKYAHLFY